MGTIFLFLWGGIQNRERSAISNVLLKWKIVVKIIPNHTLNLFSGGIWPCQHLFKKHNGVGSYHFSITVQKLRHAGDLYLIVWCILMGVVSKWSSSNCRFVTALSKKRPSDCTVDMQQMLSTGCRHLWIWRSRVCVSRIRTLKCLQNFYFLSSRCPAPAMPQQGRPPSPKTPTLSGHGFLVLAQSWPLPIPTAEPDIWCCSSAPSCPARGWMVGSNFNPHGYSTLAVTLLCVLSKPSTDFAFKTKFH